LQNESDNTHLTLIYANKSPADILLKEELDEMQRKNPNRLSVHYVLDKPATWFSPAKVGVGLETLRKHLPKSEAAILVCGPEEYACRALGV
jgi:NAD(P)H-flavin reductase